MKINNKELVKKTRLVKKIRLYALLLFYRKLKKKENKKKIYKIQNINIFIEITLDNK